MKGLVDSTLREGSQTVGVSFSLADKKRILTYLVDLGIEEIELGIATPYDRDLPELVKYSRNLAATTRIALWSPCRPENVGLAVDLQPDVLSLSIPVSSILIEKKLERDSAWVQETVCRSIAQARRGGIQYVSLGLEDATRSAADFLEQLVKTATEAGAARIRLADTVGIATPHSIAALVDSVRASFAGDIGVHLHNDFGMASGNTIAALDAGADFGDVTVLGIGERCGNARLEEVAGFLALQRGRAYETTLFNPLARLVANLANRKIDPFQPLVGPRIFHCESGLHLQGLQKDPATYEPYEPEKVGSKRQWFYGAKVGKREVAAGLEQVGIRLPQERVEPLVRWVRQVAGQRNQPLLPQEFNALLTSLL